MKLSDLVDYLNLLDSNELLPDYAMAMNRFQAIGHVIANHAVQIDNFADDVNRKLQNITNSFNDTQQAIEDYKHSIRRQISQLEPAQYQQSLALYEDEMCFETSEYILNRRLAIDPESDAYLRARLLRYTDWRVPGMIIRPGLEKFIEHLVPLDPLYVVDQDLELLEPALNQFTVEYRQRLRPYAIDDSKNEDVMWSLPDGQFGFIFAYNYFNFKPMSVLCRYIDQMYTKLRPGGVALFTFNDCDWRQGVALAEKNFMCYTPGTGIVSHASLVGFEILDRYRGQGDLAWLEIKKPGEIESIKGGQTLAKIIAIQ
jgi:tetratricopeptide (TPR) repeat protein